MQAVAGQPFTALLVDQAGIRGIGARVEVPVTRAIVTYWHAATFDGAQWSVTLDSPPDVGDYNLVWMTGDFPPTLEAFVPLHVVALDETVVDFPTLDPADVTPTVDDVALLERTRTIVDSDDTEEVTFTNATRPSADEVTELISTSVPLVLSDLPHLNINPDHYSQISHAIALYTAILIEGSFFRNQQEGAKTTMLWQVLYDNTMSNIVRAIEIDLRQAATPGSILA